ncbi:MAG: DEAD/DEAH box helicase [Fimbriimonadaceae bacterium]|nr:DEAD/DEAH box helicase [Fimbriimonadaceae bacterium]
MKAMSVEDYLRESGWQEVAHLLVDGCEARMAQLDPAIASVHTIDFAEETHPDGLYLHQVEAIHRYCSGQNVCLATGTSSGKTRLFHCAAVEEFAKDPDARVVCLYPLKALANEQEQRWAESMPVVIPGCKVGRISGDVPVKARAQILNNSHVVVMTPDVMHAWLLPNANDRHVRAFLQNLRLVVVDEAHAYTGVFGSNSGFLFRRLRHLCTMLGCPPRFVAASATIARPEEHLRLLTGLDFSIVDEQFNGARRHPNSVHFLNPPPGEDLLSTLANLFKHITQATDRRLIAFVDSRKQVELLTSIAIRGQHEEEADAAATPTAEDDNSGYREVEDSLEFLSRMSILPYRSGYEEQDRRLIQSRLSDGSLHGVISTSALELGIDIPSLDTAVLVGVPASSTSLRQRIGRVGRHKAGDIFVVNSGSIYDEAVFADPESLLTRPPAEGALYLQNTRIQYIHALCLARLGGEHDKVANSAVDDFAFTSEIEFPPGFVEICEMERTGQVPVDLQSMKHEAGESPNHTFPLRDVESSFKIICKNGPEEFSLGSLSYSQCLREAYPGAVYRYATRAFRVYQVNLRSKEVRVRKERNYVSKPCVLPTLVFPNLSHGNIFQRIRIGELVAVECNLQVREWLNGFTERRGNTEFTVTYPHINAKIAFTYPHSTFVRNYFTSGLVFFHPCMMEEGVSRDLLTMLLLESFLLVVPFERSDISAASDKLRTDWEDTPKESRFVSIYDSTYGSLHLSGRLLEEGTLRLALHKLLELADQPEVDAVTRHAARTLAGLADEPIQVTSSSLDYVPTGGDESSVCVIMPGSVGLHLTNNNEVFEVERVYWNPMENGLFYRGRLDTMLNQDDHLLTPVERVQPIPGESQLGTYNLETGDLQPSCAP